MASYKSDRNFSDYVHQNIAKKEIYKYLSWQEVQFKDNYGVHIDQTDGIDYIFLKDNDLITVQERFREKKYKSYTDFTLRYRRDQNIHDSRKFSEFFKIKAHYLVYGIVNGTKSNLETCTSFLKYAIVDLKVFYSLISKGNIHLKEMAHHTSHIYNKDTLVCPIKFNKDGSSSFIAVNIPHLIELWSYKVVIFQYGFH